MPIPAIIEIMRPKQWIKNLFVLAPLVFSHSFLNPAKIGYAVIAFAIFSLAASSVYILNDIFDLKKDRLHPLKKNRALARGAIGVGSASLAAVILGAASIIFSAMISASFLAVIISYMALNAFYTSWLKHIVIVDLFSVALGFVLRILAGGMAIGVALSPWIIGAAFFIALFIVASKRLQEFGIVADSENGRPVLGFYNKEFLRQIIFASLILTIVVYALYAFLEVKNIFFIVTILPVIYGLFRFLWLTESGNIKSDNPTDIIFKDAPLQFAVGVFAILVIVILYYTPPL